MKKYIITFFLLFSVISFSWTQNLINRYDDTIKQNHNLILINYVSFHIMTIIKVNCPDFDNAFGQSIKTKLLTDSSKIDSLELLIQRLEISDDKYLPDVRLKIYLISKDKPDDILCMSETRLAFNGIPMKRNDELISFIKRQIQ